MNITVVENQLLSGVSWWRFFRPISEMQRMYPGKFNVRFTRKLDTSDFFFTDVFILSRPSDADTLQMVQAIKSHGRSKILMDIDDAITNVPLYHDLGAFFRDRTHISREIMSLCDWFWVSTEQLLYECDCLGRGEIVPNAILPSDLPDGPAPDRGIWMWRGKGMQKEDVTRAGYEVFEKIKDIPNRWIFWGVLPNLNYSNNVELLCYDENIQSYFAKLKKAQFNGVWKPLVDCQFNDAKSNIAWIEATMSGGVCLTNYAGKTAWENAVSEMPTYKEAQIIWEDSKNRIIKDFNLINTARQRADSLFRLIEQPTKA